MNIIVVSAYPERRTKYDNRYQIFEAYTPKDITQKVYDDKGKLDKSTVPGDYYFESAAGATQIYSKKTVGSSSSKTDGLNVTIQKGDETQTVTKGNQKLNVTAGDRERQVGLNETINISGIQRVTAAKIFLN